MRRHLNVWNGVLLLSFTILYPMFFIFQASFVSPDTGGWFLESYRAIFHYPFFYLRCLNNSLFVSVLATVRSPCSSVPPLLVVPRGGGAHHAPGLATRAIIM
jgi:ABC-type spermidine/putrescine transport system permease subunit I